MQLCCVYAWYKSLSVVAWTSLTNAVRALQFNRWIGWSCMFYAFAVSIMTALLHSLVFNFSIALNNRNRLPIIEQSKYRFDCECGVILPLGFTKWIIYFYAPFDSIAMDNQEMWWMPHRCVYLCVHFAIDNSSLLGNRIRNKFLINSNQCTLPL